MFRESSKYFLNYNAGGSLAKWSRVRLEVESVVYRQIAPVVLVGVNFSQTLIAIGDVSFLIILMSWHQHFFDFQIFVLFPAAYIYVDKVFQLKNTPMFHVNGFQPVCCPNVANKLNFNTVHLHPLQFAENTSKGPPLDPVSENFPLAGERSWVPPAPSPWPSAMRLALNKDTPLIPMNSFIL